MSPHSSGKARGRRSSVLPRHTGPLRSKAPWPVMIVLTTLVGVCVGIAACGVPAEGGNVGELRGWVMDTPTLKPDVTLTDTNGEPFDLRTETEGYLTLVFFGYTHCPDICPVHMGNLGAAFGRLRAEVRHRTKVVFITTDPERDTPETLRAWLDNFDRDFIGLRGPLEDINAALSAMLLPGVAVIPGEHGSEPLIGHPAAVLAFSPDGLARVRYPFGVRQADWAHDLPLLIRGL